MIRFNKSILLIWVSLLLLFGGETVFAQGKSADSNGRHYGIGQPKNIQDLPPGQFRKQLESLPARAQGKALKWLQGVSFPGEDVKYLRAGDKGDISFADTFVPAPAEAEATSDAPVANAEALSEAQVFRLHSRPGSSNVLFLDFDGHTIEGTGWNSNGNVLVALPFDPSLNDSPSTVANFTEDELKRIHVIWHRISEDYAAYNIDVTTEEPAVFTPTTGHVLFTHDSDASGQAMPSQNAGGTAWIGVFGLSNYVKTFSPALVYYTNLSSGTYGVPAYNAEAGSHEFGHNLNLFHDGIIDGTGYYSGSGSGYVSWAPIMGYSYSNIVTQWSQGEYPNANNQEDDQAMIAGYLGYAGDDHGDSAAQATALRVEANGDILVSSPELDPDNLLPENKGIIDDRNDVDWFYLDVAETGPLSITATPAWHSWSYDDRGGNLDIELALFDSNLNLLVVDDPDNHTNATVTATVPAGRYYLQVDGVGNYTNSSYSDYGSIGMFFLEGSIQAGGSVDNTAPSPATMDWQTAPYVKGTLSITMTAVQATDDSGIVEYYFSCVAGDSACADSGWQTSRTHTASGLSADTYYSYNVRARDGFGHENGSSPSMGDTTAAPPPPPPADNQAPTAVASYSPDPVVITKGKNTDVTLNGTDSSDPDGSIVSWSWKAANGSSVGESETVSLRLKEGTYAYTLTVTDNDGATDSTNVSVAVTKGGGDDGGGGGGGKGKKPPKGK